MFRDVCFSLNNFVELVLALFGLLISSEGTSSQKPPFAKRKHVEKTDVPKSQGCPRCFFFLSQTHQYSGLAAI